MVTRLRSGSQLCTKSMPYAPSLYNFHHIKSCHPPVKQYITTHHNTRYTKVAMARAAFCVVLCAHGCIMYTGQCHHQGTSLEVSLPLSPYLPRSSLSPFLPPPPLTSSLPSFIRSVHPFLTRSLPQPSFRPPLQLPPSLTSSLPHAISLSSLLTLPSLLPILHPASLLPCLPPCLSACLRRIIQCTPCVVSGQQLH